MSAVEVGAPRRNASAMAARSPCWPHNERASWPRAPPRCGHSQASGVDSSTRGAGLEAHAASCCGRSLASYHVPPRCRRVRSGGTGASLASSRPYSDRVHLQQIEAVGSRPRPILGDGDRRAQETDEANARGGLRGRMLGRIFAACSGGRDDVSDDLGMAARTMDLRLLTTRAGAGKSAQVVTWNFSGVRTTTPRGSDGGPILSSANSRAE